jgi:tRNA A37 methylthiotransferase MiaB
MIETFKKNQIIKQQAEIGKHHLVLVDKLGREDGQYSGLTDTNKRVIMPSGEMGEFFLAKCVGASQNTLFCEPIRKMGVQEYHKFNEI